MTSDGDQLQAAQILAAEAEKQMLEKITNSRSFDDHKLGTLRAVAEITRDLVFDAVRKSQGHPPND